TMETIAAERKDPSFPVRKMTYFLDEGESNTLIREKIMLQFERDPTFRVDTIHDQTLPELRETTMQKVKKLAEFLSIEPLGQFRKRMEVMSKGALALNGVIGCFGMTELGHGSNVAGLETTATFDEASDEFIIHTPTITATKWWIGGAAQSATHCLRPGVLIGDIGSKMGRHGIDNGWIQFTYVRVPRSHLLQKFTKVSRTGAVSEPPMAQLTYGALISGRVSMVV
ncbi:fatty-acyl coenzyme A oxidase, partial [Cladochytrium tenue]